MLFDALFSLPFTNPWFVVYCAFSFLTYIYIYINCLDPGIWVLSRVYKPLHLVERKRNNVVCSIFYLSFLCCSSLPLVRLRELFTFRSFFVLHLRSFSEPLRFDTNGQELGSIAKSIWFNYVWACRCVLIFSVWKYSFSARVTYACAFERYSPFYATIHCIPTQEKIRFIFVCIFAAFSSSCCSALINY